MTLKRQLVLAMTAPLLLGAVACEKNAAASSPKVTGPTQAPTLTQTLPYEIQPQQVPPPPDTAQAEEPQKKQQQKKRQHATKKSTAPATGTANPASTGNVTATVNAAGTGNPGTNSAATTENTTAELRPPPPPAEAAPIVAIGPDVSSPEANRDRQSTNQLLDTTESQVKKLEGQNLSSDQQSVLMQIKAYITQSHKAITDGDYERASNLAKKAQLLTEELIKR